MGKKSSKLKDRIVLKIQKKQYSDNVQEYLRCYRETFLSEWAEMCQLRQGRISYEEMESILGTEYPKAAWIDNQDRVAQIQIFFQEIDFPYYEEDGEYLYFP